jgi:hypothetical protein
MFSVGENILIKNEKKKIPWVNAVFSFYIYLVKISNPRTFVLEIVIQAYNVVVLLHSTQTMYEYSNYTGIYQ